MEQHSPYLLTGSGDGPYEIQRGDQAVALLRNTTFAVATHIVKCLNNQPDLLAALETLHLDLDNGGELLNSDAKRLELIETAIAKVKAKEVAGEQTMEEIVKEIEGKMQCSCDLDNWEPERSTGHSCVCQIHKAAIKATQ